MGVDAAMPCRKSERMVVRAGLDEAANADEEPGGAAARQPLKGVPPDVTRSFFATLAWRHKMNRRETKFQAGVYFGR